MPTPLEQALLTLLPTHNTLPPTLLDLSSSLLAQSRTVAARLKQEEEIGRTYACAHIACERQKTKLGLEKLVPRPPCPPRVYKKLYAYLEGALKSAGTPKRERDDGIEGTPGSYGRSTGMSRGSTAKGRARTRLGVTAAVPTPEILKRKAAHVEEQEIPDVAVPLIEALCNAFGVSTARAHITAGTAAVLSLRGWSSNPEASDVDAEAGTVKKSSKDHESPTLTPRKRRKIGSSSTSSSSSSSSPPTLATLQAVRTEGPVTPSTLPAVLVVLTLNTIFKMRARQITGTEYSDAKDTAISSILPLVVSVTLPQETLGSDIEIFLRAAKAEAWLDQPWFATIQPSNDLEATLHQQVAEAEEYVAEVADSDKEAERAGAETETETEETFTPKKNTRPAKTPLHRKEKHAPRPSTSMTPQSARTKQTELETRPGAGLVVGLGTMFQDSIDWLSADRRAEYVNWEDGIISQIAILEREAGIAAT